MDLFGDKLREIRMEKKLSIDQVARETKISKKYLDAIEENDFSIFPSETYLIGFLRSYTEYLGLDSSKYITQYKNYKIQEQPIPINELLDIKKKIHPALLVLLIIVGVGIVAAASIFGYRYFMNKPVAAAVQEVLPKKEESTDTENKNYYFKDEINTEWFSRNDKIVFPLGNQEYTIRVLDIGNTVKLMIDDKTEAELNRKGQITIDFNDDKNADMRIVLNTIEEKEGRKQVYLGLYKITTAVTGIITNTAEKISPGTDSDSTQTNRTDTSAIPITGGADATTIYESRIAEPFVINITFNSECLFRYFADNRERKEQFFTKDQKINDINVSRNIRLWLSNAGSAKVRIAGKDVILGRAGQVVTKFIQWRRDEETQKYKLEISSIY